MDELHNQPHKENPHLFKKGQSGNPAGRRKGARNKLTVLLDSVQPGDLETIMSKLIEIAKRGYVPAMRLLINIVLRSRHDGPVKVDLPELKTAADVLAAMQKVASEVSAGELTATQGADLARIFDLLLQALGHLDLDQRMRAFEQMGLGQLPAAPLPKPGA